MASIMTYLGPLISLVSSILTAGPFGAIVAGIGALGLLAGGVFLFNKIKGFQFAAVTKQENEEGAADAAHVVTDNQHQAGDDELSESQAAKDKQAAIDSIMPKP